MPLYYDGSVEDLISRLKGRLVYRDVDYVEVETASGVVYEVRGPLSILERLPKSSTNDFEIRILQVVRDDSVTLYGFLEPFERDLFAKLLGAKGVGPKGALNMLSAYSARRLAQALVEKDVNALKQVNGIGKKTAEYIVLELADKVKDIAIDDEFGSRSGGQMPGSQEAIAALVALGYTFVDADTAVRRVLSHGQSESTDDLIRKALEKK